jgi:hypothetical protein
MPYELKPLLHRFQLLLLVRLFFQAVCPGNRVSEEAITRNHKPGQTKVSPVFCCLITQFSQGRGETSGLGFLWERNRDDYRNEGRSGKERQG